MKTIRYIIFIPIISLVIGLIYMLLPLALFSLLTLSKFWLIFLLLSFGGLIIAGFTFIPGLISWLFARISPSKQFAFTTTVLISVLLAILQIFNLWTRENVEITGFLVLINIILTLMIIGFATSISVGAGYETLYEDDEIMNRLLVIGAIAFNLGIFLGLSILALKISHINVEKTYPWFMGLWHGIFVIPNWILSWFVDGIYCKAPNSTFGYTVWWWICMIFSASSLLGGLGNSRR